MVLALPANREVAQSNSKDNSATITLNELPAAGKTDQFCKETMILQQPLVLPEHFEADCKVIVFNESDVPIDQIGEEGTLPPTDSSTAQKTEDFCKKSMILRPHFSQNHKSNETSMKMPMELLSTLSSLKGKESTPEKVHSPYMKERASPSIEKSLPTEKTILQELTKSDQSVISRQNLQKDLPQAPVKEKEVTKQETHFKEIKDSHSFNKDSFSIGKEKELFLSSSPKEIEKREKEGGGQGRQHPGQQQKEEKDNQKHKEKEQNVLKVEKKSATSTLERRAEPLSVDSNISTVKEADSLLEELKKEVDLCHGMGPEELHAQLDIIFLYIQILKLMIEGKTQETISRRREKELRLEDLQEVVKNYKKTGNWLQSAGITAGLMGIGAGLTPMLGFTSMGQSIMNTFGTGFKMFQGMKTEDFFNKASKMLSSLSQMQQTMGEVRKVNAEGERTYWQSSENERRTNSEENTRDMEQIRQDFRALLDHIINMLSQIIELTRNLYSN